MLEPSPPPPPALGGDPPPPALVVDPPPPAGTWAEAGGVRVPSVVMPRSPHVAGPTTPSGLRPWRACSRCTAASVAGPNSPSGAILSAFCRRVTAFVLGALPDSSPPLDSAAIGVAAAAWLWWRACGLGSAGAGGGRGSAPRAAERPP